MVFHNLEREWKQLKNDFCLAELATSLTEENNNQSNGTLIEHVLKFTGKEEDQILCICRDYETNQVVMKKLIYLQEYAFYFSLFIRFLHITLIFIHYQLH